MGEISKKKKTKPLNRKGKCVYKKSLSKRGGVCVKKKISAGLMG